MALPAPSSTPLHTQDVAAVLGGPCAASSRVSLPERQRQSLLSPIQAPHCPQASPHLHPAGDPGRMEPPAP